WTEACRTAAWSFTTTADVARPPPLAAPPPLPVVAVYAAASASDPSSCPSVKAGGRAAPAKRGAVESESGTPIAGCRSGGGGSAPAGCPAVPPPRLGCHTLLAFAVAAVARAVARDTHDERLDCEGGAASKAAAPAAVSRGSSMRTRFAWADAAPLIV